MTINAINLSLRLCLRDRSGVAITLIIAGWVHQKAVERGAGFAPSAATGVAQLARLIDNDRSQNRRPIGEYITVLEGVTGGQFGDTAEIYAVFECCLG